jgi:hypothetical protein
MQARGDRRWDDMREPRRAGAAGPRRRSRRLALERASAAAAALGEFGGVDPLDALQRAIDVAAARLAVATRLDLDSRARYPMSPTRAGPPPVPAVRRAR